MGGQWRSGGCLFGEAARTGSGSKESAEHQRDGHQAPTQAQTPQHHHFQVSRNPIPVKADMRDLCGSVVNARPSDLSQRYLHPGSVLLHHHGVLCTGAAV